jgi:hypothetical protein
MSTTENNRQAIRDKISETGSKDAYIISEMVRLGFWDADKPDFHKVKEYLTKEGKLSKELTKLLAEKRVLDDPEELLKSIHKERMIQSRINQKETKERKAQAKLDREAKKVEFKAKEITYLGEGYSSLLAQKQSNKDRLQENGLPVINEALQLSIAMDVSVGELRFLSYVRKNSKITHYHRFQLPKKSGGFRLISAPSPRLKTAQTWILENILNAVTIHEKAHGCVIAKSIKTNAKMHVGKAVVINQDMQNFFPSISYQRVLGAFKSLGYSGQVSTILALICTEPEVVDVKLADETYYAQKGERFLPQGSPCSPAIANIICRKLDKRLNGIATKYNFTYSRYVDDITFSAGKEELKHIQAVLKYSKKVIKEENFKLHPKKLRIMKRGGKQEGTGVVVNDKTNIDRRELRRFRALLYQIEQTGLAGKTWRGKANLLPSIHGYANFINQINPELGKKVKPQVKAILNKYDYKPINPYFKTKSKATSKGKKDNNPSILKSILNFFRNL